MLHCPATQFLHIIDNFIDHQISCTHPVVSAEIELMQCWQRQFFTLKLNKEEWQEKIVQLTRAGHAALFLFEILHAHLNKDKLQTLKWLLGSLTLESHPDVDAIVDLAGKYIDDGALNIFKRLLENNFDIKLRNDVGEQLNFSSSRYKAGIGLYTPIFGQLEALLLTTQINDNGKEKKSIIQPNDKRKEKESIPMSNQKIGLSALKFLEKIRSVKLEISYYINNRVFRQCIFHHPKFNSDLLSDSPKLDFAIKKLSPLTQLKVKDAINLLNKIAKLEKDILKENNFSIKQNLHYQNKLNEFIDESVRNNGVFDQTKVLPYLPGMSSGYESVLLKNKM